MLVVPAQRYGVGKGECGGFPEVPAWVTADCVQRDTRHVGRGFVQHNRNHLHGAD